MCASNATPYHRGPSEYYLRDWAIPPLQHDMDYPQGPHSTFSILLGTIYVSKHRVSGFCVLPLIRVLQLRIRYRKEVGRFLYDMPASWLARSRMRLGQETNRHWG